ncbi:TraI domain-containing protein [Burkholderia cepacia]|nr:TraI domain-containing protein [Burkholderia cepacia]HDR9757494.1 TraI domain-containing protein [Burkholderia cepacia ATCC 25416]MBY4735492.1 TraI domain-containing protein [Burkholderia cepacia]MBY4747437.1 TraI domain-containing protein [Burkholderia cepacia]MBY4755912.1 TraI domain-containing protein [Burkholderia cepacia]
MCELRIGTLWSPPDRGGSVQLHDQGKIAVDLQVELAGGSVWHPWNGPLLQSYRFHFRENQLVSWTSGSEQMIHANADRYGRASRRIRGGRSLTQLEAKIIVALVIDHAHLGIDTRTLGQEVGSAHCGHQRFARGVVAIDHVPDAAIQVEGRRRQKVEADVVHVVVDARTGHLVVRK